jgi:UDP-N-acetylmuramoyl-L-alanyl-D-glutamate--2,6-diaminopimelate ligase
MKLSKIVQTLESSGFAPTFAQPAHTDPEVADVCTRTDQLSDGALYCCVRGFKFDGHDFAREAEKLGARAFLAERPLPTSLPVVLVKNPRKAASEAAAAVHGFPAEKLSLAAVTGTNGKSTTAWITRSILRAGGIACGLLGTIVYDDGKREEPADRTTPDGPSLQRWLARIAKNGGQACVMEASSHGLDLHRLETCRFKALAFTNLTPEHLDFHGDMERYFQSKRRLFADYARPEARFVLNADDPWGIRLAELFPERAVPYGIGEGTGLRGKILAMGLEGTDLEISLPGGEPPIRVKSPLVGLHNVSNILAAVGIALSLGMGREAIREGIETLPPVPGRLQRFRFENGVTCFIDYAHTPDGLEKALKAVGADCRGSVHAVFGLGGETTVENRPLMGRVAAALADTVVITMDNPRSEDPMNIARQIEEGLQGLRLRSHSIILDRTEAVHAALDSAAPGDVVLLAGKGPETTMILADGPVPYSDEESVRKWSRSRKVPILC